MRRKQVSPVIWVALVDYPPGGEEMVGASHTHAGARLKLARARIFDFVRHKARVVRYVPAPKKRKGGREK